MGLADRLSDGVPEDVPLGLSDGWVDRLLLGWLVRRLVSLRGGRTVGSVNIIVGGPVPKKQCVAFHQSNAVPTCRSQ